MASNNSPVAVSGLTSGVTAIATGYSHSCAVINGGVKCWGDNANGQIGDGTTNERSTPVSVSGLTSGVTSVIAGSRYSCALLNTGKVKCWGDNSQRQLGNGSGGGGKDSDYVSTLLMFRD